MTEKIPRTHDLSLRELTSDVDGLRREVTLMMQSLTKLMDERDKRYSERDTANKDAVKAALASAKEASDKTEEALKEYKLSANEWRDTVKDLVSLMPTKNEVRQQTEAFSDRIASMRSDFDHQMRSLREKVEDLRETRGESAGTQAGTRFIKAEAQANVAIFVSVVAVLVMVWRTLMGH